MLAAVNYLKAGQMQQILDILNRCPIEERLRVFESSFLGQHQNWLPELTIPINNQPCARVTNLAQLLKYQLNVVKVADQIGQDYVVELLTGQIQLLSRHLSKFEVGIFAGREANHFAGNVDPETIGRLKCREQITVAATNLQHSAV